MRDQLPFYGKGPGANLTIMTTFFGAYCLFACFELSNIHSGQRDRSANDIAMEKRRIPPPSEMKYDDVETRRAIAQKSYELLLKEWKENGHVHENYNTIPGTGDDVKKQRSFLSLGRAVGLRGVP
jgi:hypothetical protein